MRRTLLVLCALLLGLAAPAAAQYTPDSSIVIRSFDTELLVRPSGDVEVTEVLRFAFTGQWRGILRDLSLQHHTAQGRSEKLDVELLGATDGTGRALVWGEDDSDSWTRRMRIYIPGAHNAERTVVIRYRIANAIRFYYTGPEGAAVADSASADSASADSASADSASADSASAESAGFDELYWNATGNAWDMPIEQARARIVLPDGVAPMQWAVYTGYEGSRENEAEVTVDSARGIVSFAARRRLEPGEGMTVAAGWAPGAIASRPTLAQYRRAQAVRWWPLGLPLLTFVLALRTWRRRGRDPRALAVVVQYEPPHGISPAEAGTLVDHDAQMRDVISTLVDLAVRGYVGIEEREEKKLLGLITSTEYVFHQRKPSDSWGGLLPHERAFLSGLFCGASAAEVVWEELRAAFRDAARARHDGAPGFDAPPVSVASENRGELSSVALSELQNKFYRSLPGIRDGIYKNLKKRGYYLTRPDKVKNHWMAAGVMLLVLGGMATAFVANAGFAWIFGGALIVGVGLSGILLIVFSRVMPARTVKGARAREAVLGFREFLSRVESERYRRMITSPEMFERYLPYAMAFGVEGRWARAFDDLYREPPEWYSGNGTAGFRASSFTSRMSSLTSTAGSTMSSSPSSSGSGGGGSSGGGSGGGGGSGF